MKVLVYDPSIENKALRDFAEEQAKRKDKVMYRNPYFYKAGEREKADMIVIPEALADSELVRDYRQDKTKVVLFKEPKPDKKSKEK